MGHAPLFDIRVFAELQMTCTHSWKLCSSFELQILLCAVVCPSPCLSHPPTFAGFGEYSGWQVPSLSFSWLAGTFTEFLSVTVSCGGCRSLGYRGYLGTQIEAQISLCTTTCFHRHLSQAHLLTMSLIIQYRRTLLK